MPQNVQETLPNALFRIDRVSLASPPLNAAIHSPSLAVFARLVRQAADLHRRHERDQNKAITLAAESSAEAASI